jgi:NitT/TauT family transport system substrate-binding protein
MKIGVCRIAFAAIVLGAVSSAIVGLLPGAVSGATAAAPAAGAVKFLLDARIEGPLAPFLVAVDRGYFTAAGVEVTPEVPQPANDPVARVSSGAADMALADLNVLVRHREQNPANGAVAVYVVFNRTPFAVIGRKSRGVSTPRDLEGKKLGAPLADHAALWKVFAKAAQIDAAKVTVENVSLPVREPMLAAGELDAVAGSAFRALIDLKERGVPADDIVTMPLSDYAPVLYGQAIIVNRKFAAEKPEIVRAVLAAFTRGLKDTVREPARAIDSVLRRNEALRREVELERLRMTIRDNIVTPEVRANGFGAINEDRLGATIDTLAAVFEFKKKPKASDIFDASFLPPATERALR